jgi:hypothetical protein
MSSGKCQMQNQTIEIKLKENVGSKPSRYRLFWQQGEFYFNEEHRIATVTDVKFLRDDLLIAAHREAAKLYLIKLMDDGYKIIHQKTLRTHLLPRFDRFFHPDLLVLRGNMIYMSEYSSRYAVYCIHNNKFSLRETFQINKNKYHGCHVDGDFLFLGSVKGGMIDVVNTNTKVISQLKIAPSIKPLDDRQTRIKTVGREGDYFILGMDRIKGERTKGMDNEGGDSWVGLFEQNGQTLNCISLINFENTQLDGYVRHQGNHFFTIHDGNLRSGTIQVLKVENSELRLVHATKCKSFPHGLDICN